MATKRKRGSGRHLNDETIAAALSLALTKGDKHAARAFGVSVRSLQRYKAKVASEPESELARAVAGAKKRALRQVDDLLTQTWEAVLKRIQELLPQATLGDVNDTAKTIGELRLTREALGVDDEQPGGSGTGTATSATERAAPGECVGNVRQLKVG